VKMKNWFEFFSVSTVMVTFISLTGWFFVPTISLKIVLTIGLGVVLQIGLLGLGSHNIIHKKYVALGATMIVIKYTIFIGLLIYGFQYASTNILSVTVGFALMAIPIAVLMFQGWRFSKID
jgi:hypothetical protein